MNSNCDKNYYTVELELANGDTIVKTFDKRKLYNFRQRTCHKLKLCNKFPFVILEKIARTTFRYRDRFETMEDFWDSKFCVNCSISALMDMFNIDCIPWSETLLKDAIRNGLSN